MSRINSTAAEELVDFSVETAEFDLEKEDIATDLVQELGLEQQVQDDLQKNLDATQLYLGEIGFSPCLAQKKKFTFLVKP